uniref:Uncharacterized protein n=2 Tax=Lutzomyia longipalpis TaxID=7200 RepID=A0A1B0CY28_LUTLO
MESAKTMMGIKRDCRLCLAPDNECVSIFTTAAADRESLSMKIQACVNIKVHQTDSLSPRICHACISYLNSWQSFKNRCYAAQRKQKAWLANQLQQQLREVQESKKRRLGAEGDDQQVVGKRTRETSPDEDFYLDKHSKATSATTSQRPSVAESESFIKQEPRDEEEQEGPVTVNMELDPREFLAHNDSEDEYQDDEGGHNDEGPPILTSLGLTHINHVNPFNYLATDLEEFDQDGEDGESSLPFGGIPGQLKRRSQPSIPAHCQICRMKFSNRANARRHERNIHGIKISAENGDITVVQKPPNVQPKRPGGEQGGNSGHVGGAAGGGGGGDDGKPPMATLKKPTKPVVEEFDYSKPEKYRHLLTENKLSFIRRNLKFLGQYQDMKCKCCDRVYSTYKTFMSHMRKRFLSLPRNMCFKCLRQFETKGQFIAHLKKKNCLNLYTLYMADTTISKVFHTSSASGKIGPKEILANKAYGCQLCTEHFRLKSDFRTHVLESHPDVQNFRDPITGNCTYCKATFEEASQRKRHFGNLECLVFLICGNCEERFDSNPQFLDHVYATHLTKQGRESIQKQASSQMLLMQNGDEESNREMDESGVPNSRSAQNCPVCGKQYNNYYNVLRHMESKHPDKMPKTYHCEICQTGFARQTELREHVKSAHGELSLTKVKPISFICKECKSQFDKKEAWIEHQVSHGKFMCQQCDYTVTARDEFETHLATHIKLKVYSCGVCKASFNTEEGLQYHTMTTHLVLDSDEALFREITKAESSDAAAKSEAKDPQSVVDALNLHLDGVEIIAKPRESIPKPPSQQTTPSKLDVSMDVSIEPGTSQKPLQYNSRMRCRVCQKRISSKVGYRNHLLIEHQINDCHFVSCDLCPAEFSNEKGLRVHMFRSHNVSVKEDEAIPMDQQHFECNICHTVYRSVDQLRDHVNTVHAGTRFAIVMESAKTMMGIKRDCRLCLAPDNECVSIFTTAAADRESLSMKIQACVNIKVHQTDSLSPRICHAASRIAATQPSGSRRPGWQISCNSSVREVQESKKRRLGAEGDDQQVVGKRTRETSPDEDFYPDKHSKATSATTSQRPSVAESESFIKQEPRDEEEQEGPVTVNMELDPREFLAHNDSEDEYQDDEGGHNDEGPPILTSLGLTHINHVNPFNYLATDLEEFDQDGEDGESSLPFGGIPGQLKRRSQPSIPAHCQICRMKFSNRANARRHERNIHGIKISAENGDITVVQKPPNVQPKRPGGEQGGNSGHVGGAAGGGGGGDDGKPPMATLKKPTKPVVEEFDYSKPEKYRHLLTENKLSFIRRNLKFLGQYQDMKCKCCDRVYSTYKTFMSHMRKRFLSLPRNMCFKCLRQFETKGQFIAHLKKKNCLNLYTLYMADTTISKVFHTSSASGKIGPKEILANKAYGCQLCTEHFRLKSDFRTHVLESHPDVQNFRDPITGNCTYCKATFEEASQRKRHFGNLECLVFLICGNCEERFDSNPQFLDHVYATHLTKQGRESIQKQASSQMLLMQNGDEESNREMDESGVPNSRSAQNCPVCGKQYNNYYNVLRHMESKHPDKMPKTYHCEICQTGFARQTELREHVKSAHGELSLTKVKPISFICKECKSQFDKKEAWIEHQVSHGKFMCQQCDYTVTARDEFETHLATHIKLKVYSCGVCKASFNTEEGLQYHTMTTHLVLDSDEALFREITKAESSDAAAKSEAKDPQSVVDALNLHLDGVEIIAKPRESIPKPPSQQTTPSKLDVSMDVSIEPGTSQKPLQYNSRMRCRVCQKRISSKVGYRNHLLIEHQINDCHFVSCDLCPAEFSNEKGLRVHMFRSHNVSVKEDEAIPMDQQHFECNICHTVYRSVDQLRDHVNTVHAGTSLSEFEESTEHSIVIPKEEKQAVVTEELPDYTPIEVWFQCRNHLLIEHQINDCHFVSCDLCPAEFSNEKGLRVHMFRSHNVSVKEDEAIPMDQQHFECNICHTVYRSVDQLRDHVNTVHAGTSLSEFEESTEHSIVIPKEEKQPVVTEELPDYTPIEVWFQCRYCDENFNSNKKLTIHMNTHEEHDKTDYTCRDCGNVYGTRKSLWVHRHKKHPRPQMPSPCEAIVYKCRICATPHRSHFASIKCMEAHRMPTEWKCTKCQVFFGDAQQMREHLKIAKR